MVILGIDPGSRYTGWGVIRVEGNRMEGLGADRLSLGNSEHAQRLVLIYDGLVDIVSEYKPDIVAIECVFVSKNVQSALKLGQARGIALLVPAEFGLFVGEYPPNLVKKTVVGSGHATKEQVQMMVQTLLRDCDVTSADAADALAIAICHAQHRCVPNIAAAMETIS